VAVGGGLYVPASARHRRPGSSWPIRTVDPDGRDFAVHVGEDGESIGYDIQYASWHPDVVAEALDLCRELKPQAFPVDALGQIDTLVASMEANLDIAIRNVTTSCLNMGGGNPPAD
jgi:hypothetical protein